MEIKVGMMVELGLDKNIEDYFNMTYGPSPWKVLAVKHSMFVGESDRVVLAPDKPAVDPSWLRGVWAHLRSSYHVFLGG